MEQFPSRPVTELLHKWRAGDPKALEALLPLVYDELRYIAHRCLRRERPGHTLQSTALVHEAYLRMVKQEPPDTQNRSHFAAVAARLMRQILVEYARARRATKRSGDCRVEVVETLGISKKHGADVVALDDALNELAEIDEQQSRIVELRYFGGLTIEEAADVLEISPATVKRDWSVAKVWLSRAMRKGRRDEPGTVEKN